MIATVRVMVAAGESVYHLAEWYLPELTEQSVDDMVARLDAAATVLTGEGTPVRFFLHSRCRKTRCSTECSAPTR